PPSRLMRKNLPNILFFIAIAVGFWFLWSYAEKNWFPQRPNPAAEAKKKAEEDAKKAEEEKAKREAEEKEREQKGLAPTTVIGTILFGAEEAKAHAEEIARQLARERAIEEKKQAASAVAGTTALLYQPRKPPRETATLIAFGDDKFYTRYLLTTRG